MCSGMSFSYNAQIFILNSFLGTSLSQASVFSQSSLILMVSVLVAFRFGANWPRCHQFCPWCRWASSCSDSLLAVDRRGGPAEGTWGPGVDTAVSRTIPLLSELETGGRSDWRDIKSHIHPSNAGQLCWYSNCNAYNSASGKSAPLLLVHEIEW